MPRRTGQHRAAGNINRAIVESQPVTGLAIRSQQLEGLAPAATRAVLGPLDYAGKDETLVSATDASICGGPELWRPA